MENEILKELQDIVGAENVKYNEPMSKHTSFKVGGNAEYFVEIYDIDILKRIVDFSKNNNLVINVVGNGTNLLVLDSGIKGLVIRYVANKIEIIDNYVSVDAGVLNGILAQELLKNELSGFEFASGIPGTIGGAVFMNAGAYGSEIKDIIEEVTYFDMRDKTVHIICNNECKFDYRKSIFSEMDTVILNAKLRLNKSSYDLIKKKMDEYRDKRISTQPLNKPNAGSTFKRGDGFITAQLIDEAGLKGFSIGGARVSEKHAGFIVNDNNATAKDIIELIEYVKKTIYEKYNKKIEVEVRILG